MKKVFYPACFYKEEDGGYSVIFPDFGNATCGDNFAEAMYMAEDLLGGLIVSMQDDGEEIPAPSDIQNVKAVEYPNGFVSLVGVDTEAYRQKTKSIKKTLTIPEWLNAMAESHNINFSKVLQEALKSQLNING